MAAINTTFGFKDEITQNLSLLNNALTTLNKTLSAMQGEMSGANTAIQGVSKSAATAASEAGGLSSKLLNFNMATQVFHTVKGAVDSLGQSVSECSSLYNFQIAQETKLESVMRSRMKTSDETIQSIKDFASAQQEIGVIGDEVQLAGAQELATYLDNAENLKTLLPMLNDVAVQASSGGEVTAQLETSMATMIGKVMAGNLSGMSRRGWDFTEEEKAAFKQMNEEQRAQFLANYAKDAIGNQNADFAKTAQGQMIQLQNQIGDMKEEVGRAIQPFMQLKSIVTGRWQVRFYETIIRGLNFMKEHINQVIIVLGVLGAVGVAIAVRLAVAWIAAHLPMIAMVTAILLVVAALSTLLIFSEKTFPAIGGFIGGLGNTFKAFGNNVRYDTASVIEFVVNGFLKMREAVDDIFLTMIDVVLAGLEKIAPAMDAVFHTDMTSKIGGVRESLQAFKDAGPAEFSLGWKGERMGYKDAWEAGKAAGEQKGADLSKNMNEWLDKQTAGIKNAVTEQKSALDNLSFDSDGSLKTSDSSLVDISDDYRELLSARARERFNLKFSQITPQITIEHVDVHGDEDLANASIGSLADGLEEYADSTARGVA